MIFPMLAHETDKASIIQEYLTFINAKEFPCIAAKAAVANQQARCMVAGNMACPKDDYDILQFLYNFVDEYRTSKNFYHSAVIIFQGKDLYNEEMFDALLWQRLNALQYLDAQHYDYDNRVE